MHTPQAPEPCSRRGFLRLALAGMTILGTRLLLPDPAAAALPEGRLRLFNANTDERLTVRYRQATGRYDRSALQDINYLLRCHHSHQVCQMDIRLLEHLNHLVHLVGRGQEIVIYSAYRSPAYNDLLVRLGRGAAPNSLHTSGKALDIAIPGVKLSHIRRTAMRLKFGGVGNYARRGFIHIDTGPCRYW